jgi:putative transposase
MRTAQYTVTPKDVQAHAAHLCQRHLRLKDHGPKTTAATLLAILCYAAARITSLGAACKALLHAPGYQAAHDALLATLPTISALLRRLNRALQGDLPHALRRRRQPIAIDLHLVPYHGSHLYDEDEVYRGPAKSGTSHFHAYATAYVIRKGQRFTVALAYVRKGQPLKEVIRELLRQAARAGV